MSTAFYLAMPIYIMPVHLNSLGMYGQDELKPEWVSSAWSCFSIALILKHPSLPQLEWGLGGGEKEKGLQRHFLILMLYPNCGINIACFGTIYITTGILKNQCLLLNISVL